MMKNRLSAYSERNIGGREEQQDNVLHLVSTDGERALLVIADGMGGHIGGKQASVYVITAAKIEWKNSRECKELDPVVILKNIFKLSFDFMNEFSKREDITPRSTCVALIIKDNTAYYAHIGDSRLYHFRGGKLLSKTKDHSVVQMLADMEQIQEDDMGTHEDQGKLLKWIGGKKEPEPTFNKSIINSGDQFLLCSDGLWEHVSKNQIETVLNSTSDLNKKTKSLIQLAKISGGEKGDNISVAVLIISSLKNKFYWLFILGLLLLLMISFSAGYILFNSDNKITLRRQPSHPTTKNFQSHRPLLSSNLIFDIRISANV